MKQIHPKANLKSNYTILFQISLILSLVFMLALTKITLPSQTIDKQIILSTDSLELIDLPQPIPPENPPTPIKPIMPLEVPDHTIIIDEPEIPNLEIDDFFYDLPQKPTETIDDGIFDSFGMEMMPTMLGGLQELYGNIKYPDMARKSGIEGIVTVQFIVNKKGDVENPEILRGIGGGCDEEVLRVIQKMKFSPGVQNGTIVKVRMAQSVRFQLQN